MNKPRITHADLDEMIGPHQLNKYEDFLYHYTSINSLQSIVENMELWATHSKFMNDAGESKYFWELFDEVLNEYSIEFEFKNPTESMRNNIEFAKKRLSEAKKFILRAEEADIVHILSFSMNFNSLSMWNYYGRNDGYCITMKPEQIQTNWTKNNYGAMIGAPVIYSRSKQKEILINELTTLLKNHNKKFTSNLLNMLFIRWIFYYSSFFKHESFEVENEFRIAFRAVRAEIFYRTYQGAFAPYIKIDLKNDENKLEIDAITCGPYIDHDEVLLGLERWLAQPKLNLYKKLTIKGGELSQSNIPIRF